MALTTPSHFDDLIAAASAKHNVPVDLIHRTIQAESNYDPNAVSSAGAQGLMQLMPPTAKELGVTNSFDAAQNIDAGVAYLAKLTAANGGDPVKGAAAYNWGPGNLARSKGGAYPEETQNYIRKIFGEGAVLPGLSQEVAPQETLQEQQAGISEYWQKAAVPSEIKGNSLTAASTDKQTALASTSADKRAALGEQPEASNYFTDASQELARLQEKESDQQVSAYDAAQGVINRGDEDSQMNKGKWVTAMEEEHGSAADKFTNMLAGAKSGVAQVAGKGARALVDFSGSSLMQNVTPGAGEAYEKEARYNKLQGLHDDLVTETEAQRASGGISDSEGLRRILTLRQEIAKATLTPDETKLLDSKVRSKSHALRPTNRELIEEAKGNWNFANTIDKTVDKVLQGTANHQTYMGDKLIAEFGRLADKNSIVTDEAFNDIKNGDVVKGLAKGVPAFIAQVAQAITVGVQNPNAALQIISEELPDLVLTRFGHLGLATSIMESVGLAAQTEAEGIQTYMKDHDGKTPDEAAHREIAAWAWAGAAADMGADLAIGGVSKGVKSAFKMGAEVAPKTLAGTAGKGAMSVAKNAGVESVTEGFQEIAAEKAKMHEIKSTKDALVASSVGAVAGGGAGPVGGVVEGAASVVMGAPAVGAAVGMTIAGAAVAAKDKLADTAEKTKESIKPASSSRTEFDHNTKAAEAAESGDTTQYADPENEEYDPLLAVDALKSMHKDATDDAKVEHLNKATEILDNYENTFIEKSSRLMELKALVTDGTITDEQGEEMDRLIEFTGKHTPIFETTAADMQAVIDSMKQVKSTPKDAKANLAAMADSTDTAGIGTAVIGVFAHNGGVDSETFGSTLSAIQNNPNTSPEDRELISSNKIYQQSKQEIRSTIGRTPDAVHSDVLMGSRTTSNKGADKFQQNIAVALQSNNVPLAGKEFTGLSKFAQDHQLKATTLRNITNAMAANKPVAKEDIANLAMINAKPINKKKPFGVTNPTAPKWLAVLKLMELEAKALNNAVTVAENMFAARKQELPAAVVVDKPAPAADSTPPVEKAAPATKEPAVEKEAEPPVEPNNKIAGTTTFSEDQSPGYRERTMKNASADATIAIAVDFNSAGERLTKSSVNGQGKQYIPLHAGSLDVTEARVNTIVDRLNAVKAKTLNIAGNGIYTMKGKYTQAQVDDFTYQLLKAVLASPRLQNKIESIRTGGQTGFDEAGAKAGMRLGIATVVLAPKGWKFRNIDSKDISDEAAFKARFDGVTIEKAAPTTTADDKQSTSQPEADPVIPSPEAVEGAANTEEKVNEDTAPTMAASITEDEPGVDLETAKPEDYTTLNLIRAWFKPARGLKYNLLHTMPNMFAGLKALADNGALGNLTTVFNDKKHPITMEAHALVVSMADFAEKFAGKMHTRTFRPKTGTGLAKRSQDPVQYLTDENNKLRSDVVDAMAAVAYKFLADPMQGKRTLYNDDQAIRKVLSLDKETKLTTNARNLLKYEGIPHNMLVEALGKEAYRLLGIKPTGKAPGNMVERIQLALGNQIIANMQEMGLLTEKEVFTGDRSDTKQARMPDAAKLAELGKAVFKTFGNVSDQPSLVALGTELYRVHGNSPKMATAFGYEIKEALKKNPGDLKTASIPRIIAAAKTLHITPSSGTFGISGLRAEVEAHNAYDFNSAPETSFDPESFNVPGERTRAHDGMTATSFYQIASHSYHGKPEPTKTIQDMLDLWRNSKQTWERMFTGKASENDYTWTKPVFGKKVQFVIDKTRQLATIAQSRNLANNMKKPYQISTNTVGWFRAFTKEQQMTLAGATDHLLEHVEDRDSVESTNKGYEREIEAFNDWFVDAELQPDGINTPFYIPAKVYRNIRMGQVGAMNPQGSKVHRFLFGMQKWTSTITLGGRNNKAENRFLEAVGQALDVEAAKAGGQKATLKKVNETLAKPEIAAAVKAIRKAMKLIGDKDINGPEGMVKIAESHPEIMKKVMAGVAAGGAKVHSLRGLIEYARYKDAKAKVTANNKAGVANEFATDLTLEIDGLANGPTLARLQMMMSITARNLAALRNSGLAYSSKMADIGIHLANPRNLDAYKTAGMAWNDALAKYEDELRQTLAAVPGNKGAQSNLKQLLAAKQLFGKFNDDDGFVNSVLRKMTKQPTMTTVYGVGETSLINGLIDTLLSDKIYPALKKIAHSNDREGLERLVRNINDLANLSPKADDKHKLVLGDDFFDAQGNIIPENVLTLKIPFKTLELIGVHVAEGHGAALVAGIDEVYGDIKEHRESINQGFVIATALYNIARKKAVEARKQELITAKKLPIVDIINHKDKAPTITYADLSKEEYEAIDERIKGIYPTMATTFVGGRMDMTQNEQGRDYSLTEMVQQSYGETGRKDNVPKKTSYLREQNRLKNPGVSALVMGIQMTDGSISNLTQGRDLDILNCHDGFICGINEADAVNQALNENMEAVVSNYDLLHEMHAGVVASMDAFKAYRATMTTKPSEWNAAIDAEFKEMGIESYVVGSNGKKRPGTTAETVAKALGNMKNSAAIATENKAKVVNTVHSWNHYYLSEGGHVSQKFPEANPGIDEGLNDDFNTLAAALVDVTKTDADRELDIMAGNVDNIIGAENEQRAAELKSLLAGFVTAADKDILNSAPDSGLSEDVTDYPMHEEINQQDLLDIYQNIKGNSVTQDSAEHDAHLQRILQDIVADVVQPMDLYMSTRTDAQTEGKFKTQPGTRDSVFIANQVNGMGPVSGALSHGILMSTGEVYVHEVLHAVLHAGLKANGHLQQQVEALYQLARTKLDANGEGYKHFLLDPMLDVSDPANQFEVEAAKDRWNYIFVTPPVKKVTGTDSATGLTQNKEYSRHLDEFASLGLSNERFFKALAGIEIDPEQGVFKHASWKGTVGKNIQETLLRIYRKVMDFITNGYRTPPQAGNVAEALEQLAKRLTAIDSKNKSKLFATLNTLEGWVGKVAQYSNARIMSVFNKYPRANVSRSIRAMAASMADTDSLAGEMLREIRHKLDGMHFGFMQTIAREMRGLTPRLAALHKLLNVRGIIIDKARTETATAYINVLQDLWSRELTKQEKAALHAAVLKTDLDSLRDHFSLDDITAMVGSETTLDATIAGIVSQMEQHPVLKEFSYYYEKQARSLGFFMSHGRTLEEVSFLSTQVIASLRNTRYASKVHGDTLGMAEKLIDQMSSLYALKFVTSDQRNTLHSLLTEDANAVAGVMRVHRELKRDARESLFGNNPYMMVKGYTKEITNHEVNIKIGTLADKIAFEKEGYIKSNEAIPRDPRDPDKGVAMFIYSNRLGTNNDLQSSIASNTGDGSKGVNLRQIRRQIAGDESSNLAQGYQNSTQLSQAKLKALHSMFQGKPQPFKRDAPRPNYMVPKVGTDGMINDYRYVMAESTKNSLLEKHNDYDAVLGAMAGQLVDKQGTKIINKKLVQALKDMYDNEYDSRYAAYVEVSPYATEPRHRDIYFMLPDDAKQAIVDIWGSDKMYVSKDVIDLAFGQRKYSVIEAFGKTEADRNFVEKAVIDFAQYFFGNKGITTMKHVESFLQGLTAIAKNNIVVKSFTVTLGNYMSNLVFCKMKGVSGSNILRWKQEATLGIVQYQKDKQSLDEVQIKLRMQRQAGGNTAALDTRVRELKNKLARNPVINLMDAGMMQSIVDDVETSNIQSPYPGLIDKYIDKGIGKLEQTVGKRVATPIVNVGKVLFLSPDTQAYKTLNNAVKMTDFIGRYIMYQHYTDTTRGDQRFAYKQAMADPAISNLPRADRAKAVESFIHDKAVAQVIHEFVNFSLPTHRMVEYGNTLGFLMFTKYALRILKPIKDTIKEQPFEAITAFLFANMWGISNIFQAIPFVSKNPLSVFSDPLSIFVETMDDSVMVSAGEGIAGMAL